MILMSFKPQLIFLRQSNFGKRIISIHNKVTKVKSSSESVNERNSCSGLRVAMVNERPKYNAFNWRSPI